MSEYLRVKNWDSFQHYKDRSPPWIKLHRDLLRDYEFICLQDASKMQLILIWLLASQMDNKIPADAKFIQSQLSLSNPIDLKELINKGFLIDDSGTLADCKQIAIVETEAETYSKETEKSIPPTKEAVSIYNEIGLPQVQVLSDKRKRNLTARLSDCGGIEGWVACLEKVKSSDFLMGRTKDWKADFDFIITQSKFIKIMEGCYDNQTPMKTNKLENTAKELIGKDW